MDGCRAAYDGLKDVAQAASLGKFKGRLAFLRDLDALGAREALGLEQQAGGHSGDAAGQGVVAERAGRLVLKALEQAGGAGGRELPTPPTPPPPKALRSTPTTWPPSPPTSPTPSAGSATGPSTSPHRSRNPPLISISNPASCSPPDAGIPEPPVRDYDSWCHIGSSGTHIAQVLANPGSGLPQGAERYLRHTMRRPGLDAEVAHRLQAALEAWDARR
ncbi:hypothetical protein Misp01_67080 [Microtetraspora sp. NBRC 13810]|nr:hypothetical protein Misp01_67080 [Microtetraspora sp. NBRC 13810]